MAQVVRQLEDIEEEQGEPLVFGPPDPDDWAELMAEEERERRENEGLYLDTLDPGQVAQYFEDQELDAAQKAAEDCLGRGAKGMSERSRREMWRWVLSLPFEMLGDRPLWITLTYPGDWRQWVPDGPTLERHRRAIGEAWYRGFGERPVGFWSKEFQLAEGRPHLHLLMKGPESMPDDDYRGFQMLTRLGNQHVRRHGKHQGRWWTPPNHARRGVNVRTVFYAKDDQVASRTRRAALAAYMAGEASKAKQKVPPDGFGAVGRYFGTFGYRSGFKPTVELMEVEELARAQPSTHPPRNPPPPSQGPPSLPTPPPLRRREEASVLAGANGRRPGTGGLCPPVRLGVRGGRAEAPETGSEGRLRNRGDRLTGTFEQSAGRASHSGRWRPAVRRAVRPPGSHSVQDLGSPTEHTGIERVQVRAHRRRRVRVAEHLLDVQQVDVVRAIRTD